MFPVNYTKYIVIVVYDNVVVPEVDMEEGKGTMISVRYPEGKLSDPWREIGNLSNDFFMALSPNLLHSVHRLDKSCFSGPCFEVLRCCKERPTEFRERANIICSILKFYNSADLRKSYG